MIFNTGSALLDAIVLAVVSKDAEGTYGYKITQDVRQAIDISESTYIRCCAVCRRRTAWRYTTWLSTAETADTIKLRRPDVYS